MLWGVGMKKDNTKEMRTLFRRLKQDGQWKLYALAKELCGAERRKRQDGGETKEENHDPKDL